MSETVVLVPGIGLGGIELVWLCRQLRAQGFRVQIFWRNPWRRPLTATACALHQKLSETDMEKPHIVAHSLGGRVIVQMLADFPQQAVGRIVFLGVPLSGCLAAQRCLRVPGGRWVLGEALTSLCTQPFAAIPSGHQTGSIAGRLNLLLGLMLCPRKPNDTLVCVEETQHPEVSVHYTLPVSHTSMLFSRQVSDAIAHFLRSGVFPAVAEGRRGRRKDLHD